ncbi:MAG: SIGNAL-TRANSDUCTION SENSOR PROTEIN-PAS/PAC domain [uncultured Sulfurovum sp.]|uniref:SIGNAL-TRANSDUCTION SENSOR PROTEIN-PAS/PAC domain n=1 Tax=uncultured Sulfurovum sp. TaxID=269237 RepID=A0A6S6TT58_9BACT|nr:MAG: SIGNAL-TRANSDUCTION SENSOR PROTEIN-PAS/PAC domain [uncultured Sulfurovum sp.]
MIYRPIVLDEEIKFSRKKFIVSKTDLKGKIIFTNKNFSEISGYTEAELVGENHNILRHPDMPKAVFFLVWKTLLAGNPISGVIKNLAKDGRYYWVIADLEAKKDTNGNIIALTAFRRAAPQDVIDKIEELYATMVSIEKKHGMEKSLAYVEAYLEDNNLNYNEFIKELTRPKGILGSLLDAFKRMLR